MWCDLKGWKKGCEIDSSSHKIFLNLFSSKSTTFSTTFTQWMLSTVYDEWRFLVSFCNFRWCEFLIPNFTLWIQMNFLSHSKTQTSPLLCKASNELISNFKFQSLQQLNPTCHDKSSSLLLYPDFIITKSSDTLQPIKYFLD